MKFMQCSIDDCGAKAAKRGMFMHRRNVVAGLLAAPSILPFAGVRSAGAAVMGRPDSPALLRPAVAPAAPVPLKPATSVIGGMPRWQRYAVPAQATDGRPIITIVIDDLGVIQPGTRRTLAMVAPITLAWFPFANQLPDQVSVGVGRGHESILHMPMQSFSNSTAQTGPDPLRIDLPVEENMRRLVTAIDAVPDTVGLNNHMGSVATRDPALMALVAQEALRRDMLFLDSVTIGHSQAYRQSADIGVPAASRDVFIDDVANRDLIMGQLMLIERVARQKGHVIAIGHPRPLTMDALEWWLPTLAGKGFVLWPLSATIALRNSIAMPAA